MEKTTLVTAISVALLVVGVLFVSANIPAEEAVVDESGTCNSIPKTCGPSTCKQQCGGTCGIPSCGCT